MKDASLALRKAYVNLLSGLTYNGTPVAVYSLMAPSDAAMPYVILGPWIATSDNTKDTFGQDGQITLDVVTGYVGDATSVVPGVTIANSITTLLKPTPTSEVLDLTADGVRVWLTVVEGTQDISLETSTRALRRKLITIRHGIVEQ